MPAPVRLRREERHSLSVPDAIESFARWLRVHKAQPELRVRNYYLYPMRKIVGGFCTEHDIDALDDLDRYKVDEIVLSIEGMKKKDGSAIAPATRVAYLKATKYFFNWAASEDLMLVDGDHIGIPGLKRKDKDLLTPGEELRLVGGARTVRDALIIRTILETAVRESGIAALHGADIIERDRKPFLRFQDKTAEARWAPITRDLYRDLVAYRDGAQRRSSRSELLFVADRRDPKTRRYEPLTTSGIYRAVKLAGDAAGLERERIKPHWLRARAITRMCAKGMNPVLVSEITGVSLAVISKFYARPTPEELWDAAALARGK